MSLASSIRNTVRNLINSLGSTAYVYSFASATKSQNSEGDYHVTNWGNAVTIKAISSNNYKLRKILAMQGEETNSSDRVLIIRDDATVGKRDKLVIDNETYEITEIKKLNPIENTLIAQRVVLSKNENY